MGYPQLYDVTYSYTGFQEAQGDNSFPGTQLDSDLAGLNDSVSSLSLFLKTAVRSDGQLNNGIVTYDSLGVALQTAGLAPANAWATGVSFLVGNSVVTNSNLYRCLVAHTSGVFATDLAAGKWVLVGALIAGADGTDGVDGVNGTDGVNGAAGPTAWTVPAAWITASAYAAGPPANVVTQGGETYVCLVPHTSGVFATDLAAGKWIKVAQKGADGAGAGGGAVDVVAAYGVNNAGTAIVNASLQTAVNAICAAGATVYLPPGTYDMGSGTLTVPAYGEVIAHRNATIKRTADPATFSPQTNMIDLLAFARFTGGKLVNASMAATSSSSNTIGSGSKAFTVAAGLTFGSGYARLRRTSDHTKIMEGAITSYTGTTLTVNVTFTVGSGTFSDWEIFYGSAYGCAIGASAVDGVVIEDVAVSGPWYVAVALEAVNPSGAPGRSINDCVIRNCSVVGHLNRGFYVYGTSDSCLIENCKVDGLGQASYGYNTNPGNAVGNTNTVSKCVISKCRAKNLLAYGFAFGEQTTQSDMLNCIAVSTNIGFMFEVGNSGLSPQYCKMDGCRASFCAQQAYIFIGVLFAEITDCQAIATSLSAFYVSPAANSAYITFTGCLAHGSGGGGFYVDSGSFKIALSNCQAISNTGTGITFTAGTSNCTWYGNLYGNGAPSANAGTGNAITAL